MGDTGGRKKSRDPKSLLLGPGWHLVLSSTYLIYILIKPKEGRLYVLKSKIYSRESAVKRGVAGSKAVCTI